MEKEQASAPPQACELASGGTSPGGSENEEDSDETMIFHGGEPAGGGEEDLLAVERRQTKSTIAKLRWLQGRWEWLHDGRRVNGWLIFQHNGFIETNLARSGTGDWQFDGEFMQATFGTQHHLLRLTGDLLTDDSPRVRVGRPQFELVGRRLRDGGAIRVRRALRTIGRSTAARDAMAAMVADAEAATGVSSTALMSAVRLTAASLLTRRRGGDLCVVWPGGDEVPLKSAAQVIDVSVLP